ncbi:MAG: hypothetical protein ABMA15_03545 [Vicinamibacterales bacterium]
MMSLMQPPPDAFTVKIMPKQTDVEGLADVLIGSLGLAGVLVLAGVVLAVVFAGGLYLFRLKFGDPYPSASEHELGSNGQGGNITR